MLSTLVWIRHFGHCRTQASAGCALGVDNDPQAVVASRDNAQRNDIDTDDFTVVMPDDGVIAQWDDSADLMVANILAGPLVELADQLIS